MLFLHEFLFHEAAERDRPAEAERAEAQEIADDLADRLALG
jgi:hypothetical protein